LVAPRSKPSISETTRSASIYEIGVSATSTVAMTIAQSDEGRKLERITKRRRRRGRFGRAEKQAADQRDDEVRVDLRDEGLRDEHRGDGHRAERRGKEACADDQKKKTRPVDRAHVQEARVDQ
jgi:hypothetical protein